MLYNKNSQWHIDNYRRDNIFPTSETNPALVHPRENEVENIATNLEFTHEVRDFFINSVVSYDNTDHLYKYIPKRLQPGADKTKSSYDYQEDRDQDRISARVSGGYHFHFGEIAYTPTLGTQYEKTTFDQTKSYLWSPQPLSLAQETSANKGTLDTERQILGFFLCNELDFGEDWEFNIGGRVDDVKYDVKNRQAKHVTQNVTDYSWNVTPAFHPTQDSTIYASASRSYWYPVLQYYKYAMEYGSAEYRPEDLEPENYLTYEVGYKHYFGSKLSLAVAGYHMKVKDKFLSFYDDTDVWRGYFNVGTSKHMGLELEASGRLSSFFGYRFSGAYQDAEWDEADFRAYTWGATPVGDKLETRSMSSNKVPQVPDFTSTLGLDFYFLEYFKFGTDINYYGERYIDMPNHYKRGDYTTVDASLFFMWKNWKIWVLGTNIFDREVENISNERGRRNADGTPRHSQYFPLDGRYIEAGVTLNF